MSRNRATAKQAGSKFELAVARFLNAHTPLTVSRRARTQPDTGDIEGVTIPVPVRNPLTRIVIECKNTADALILPHMREAQVESDNDIKLHRALSVGVLVQKMPGIGMSSDEAMRSQPVFCRAQDADALYKGHLFRSYLDDILGHHLYEDLEQEFPEYSDSRGAWNALREFIPSAHLFAFYKTRKTTLVVCRLATFAVAISEANKKGGDDHVG